MAAERMERRLAAILAADVAGYSRLMGADEEGTLARLKALRSELIDPAIAEHNGRIVKTTGDGLLVDSPASSTRCAAHRNAARDGRAQRRVAETGGSSSASASTSATSSSRGRHLRRRGQYRGAAGSDGRAGRHLRLAQCARPDPRPARLSFEDMGEQSVKNMPGRCGLRAARRPTPHCRAGRPTSAA